MTKHLKRFLLVLVALCAGCALFAPSKSELMAYCVTDPEIKKLASQHGVTPEQLCEKLLREESGDAKPATAGPADAGARCDGSCPIR